jgi:putative solute:sodium symporter small subunit
MGQSSALDASATKSCGPFLAHPHKNKGVTKVSNTDLEQKHWAATTRLTWTMLAIWAFFAFIIHIFAPSLNGVTILGFPLGYYMAGQGSLIVFVVMLFIFAAAQDKIDRAHGVAEDE